MSVPMKKITLLMMKEHQEAALKSLRRLGILHIQDIKPPVNDNSQVLENKLNHLEQVLKIISAIDTKPSFTKPDQCDIHVEKILTLLAQKKELQHELDELLYFKQWYQKWGAISIQSVQQLHDVGIFIHLYGADKKEFHQIPEDKAIHVAFEDKTKVYFAFFSSTPDERLSFKEEPLPTLDLKTVEFKISQVIDDFNQIDREINKMAQFKNSFVYYHNDLKKRIEANRIMAGMGEIDSIVYLEGYCPDEEVMDLKRLAYKEGWGYIVAEPDEPAEVPTVLQNRKGMRLVQPIYRFLGILPGYIENDISLAFLLFFSLFFAVIIGDGGYGLIFLVSTFYLSRKFGFEHREIIDLFYFLSITTIIWGLVTGNWFGVNAISHSSFFKIFAIPQLQNIFSSYPGRVMYLCIVLAALQLSIAHLLSAYYYRNSLKSLAELGWILILGALFVLINSLLLKMSLPKTAILLFGIGILMILIFSNYRKNVFQSISLNLTQLPLSILETFTNMVSYLRLYVIGIGSYFIGNNLSNYIVGEGGNKIVTGMLMMLIFLILHLLNIGLGGTQVLVHGVRFNLLEFSNQAGINWSGKPFQPLRE
jgi:V/A-type H+/Na+-transporting ATPase subunit I